MTANSPDDIARRVSEIITTLSEGDYLGKRAKLRQAQADSRVRLAQGMVTELWSRLQSMARKQDVIVAKSLGAIMFYDILASATFIAQAFAEDVKDTATVADFIQSLYTAFSEMKRDLDPDVREGFDGAEQTCLPNYLSQIRKSREEGFFVGSADPEAIRKILIGDGPSVTT